MPFNESHIAERHVFVNGTYTATLDLPELNGERYEEPGWMTVTCKVWENYDEGSKEYSDSILSLENSCGSFSWNKSDRPTVEERTSFDRFYIETECQVYEEMDSGSLEVTLPDGFSFEENAIVANKTLTIPPAKQYDKFTSTLTVYPIYAPDCSEAYLNLKVDVASEGELVDHIDLEVIQIMYNVNSGKIGFANSVAVYDGDIRSDLFVNESYQYNHELSKLSLALSGMEYCKKERIE